MDSKYWGMEKGPKLTRNYEMRTQTEIMPMRIRKQRWTLRFYGALNLNLDLESCLRNVRRIYAYIFFSFKDVTRERAKLRSNNLECLTLTICSLNKNKNYNLQNLTAFVTFSPLKIHFSRFVGPLTQ